MHMCDSADVAVLLPDIGLFSLWAAESSSTGSVHSVWDTLHGRGFVNKTWDRGENADYLLPQHASHITTSDERDSLNDRQPHEVMFSPPMFYYYVCRPITVFSILFHSFMENGDMSFGRLKDTPTPRLWKSI